MEEVNEEAGAAKTGALESEVVPEEEESNWRAALKTAKENLKQCLAEKKEYLDGSQRLKADYLNLQKQLEREGLEIVKFAKEELLLELVELADAFELAFANKAAWQDVPENWRRGVEYIYVKLVEIFRRNRLEEINPLKEKFDPLRHHSLAAIDILDEEEDNIILEVVQRGYLLDGKVVRPAQVKVGRKQL